MKIFHKKGNRIGSSIWQIKNKKINSWGKIAQEIGISRQEQEMMASAFKC